jgi:ubiquinone/menaquinone biosynthesis C-methylase UbiE
MTHRNHVDTVNRTAYANAKIVAWYDKLDSLFPAERKVLEKLTPLIKDKKLLDIGIGGGRTTKFLLQISKNYTGIDYSPASIETAKRKHPAAALYCCDARDLGRFDDKEFDLVLFSLNGIDYVNHEDRIRTLQEIHRVLKGGGFLIFSAHNRHYRNFNKLPWQEESAFNLNYLKSCVSTIAYLFRHLTMKKHELYADDYAIINDSAHAFSLLTYYITIDKQREQLSRIGFVETESYDMMGNQVSEDSVSPWIHYLSTKSSG